MKVILTRTRAEEAVVKGRRDDTTVAISAKSSDNIQTKRRKKERAQVNIRGKKNKYMSTLRTRAAKTT